MTSLTRAYDLSLPIGNALVTGSAKIKKKASFTVVVYVLLSFLMYLAMLTLFDIPSDCVGLMCF